MSSLTYVYAAVTCRPSWYQPISPNYQTLEQDKHAQLRLENKISAALNARAPVECVVDQAQINRWIAARHELWPGEVPSIEPFDRPIVVLEGENRVRLAARLDYSGVSSIVSAVFSIQADRDRVVVTWDSIQAGNLPAPRNLLERAVNKAAAKANFPALSIVDGRAEWPNDWTWPNGKKRFRIASLSVARGELHVKLEPL